MRALLFVAAVLVSVPAFAAGKKAPAKKATGVSQASVDAAVKEFVEALNSLDDNRVLASLAPADRLPLKGRDNLIGVVYGKKLLNPVVKSWEKVDAGGKTVGAKAVVSLEEVDPIDSTKVPKDRTWFLSLDGQTLKVSLASVWLDSGKVGEPSE